MMFDPRLLRAFAAIADSGGFTAAAERLNMTQSTISQQLARLEDAIGHALIDRAARPVQVTPAGERLLGYARRILALQQEAATFLADPVGSAAVRVGVPDDIVSSAMSAAFAAFAAQHRTVRLDVATGLSRDLAKRYRAGEFDVVVVKEESADADHRASFPETIGWYEGANAAAEWRDPVPLVAFPPGGLYRDRMFERLEREQRRCYVAFTGTSLTSVLNAVEAGMGLSLLPTRATRGFNLRPASYGAEAAMVVSLYAWETGGPIAELAARMTTVLASR